MQFFADGFQLKNTECKTYQIPHHTKNSSVCYGGPPDRNTKKENRLPEANDGASAGCSAASRGWCARAGRLREKEHEVLREYPTQVLGPNLTQE